jgi:hypothetical protein
MRHQEKRLMETTTTSTPEATPKKNPVVAALTETAAKALEATKRGLEAGAKWLDARAKDVGDLAAKIATKPA